MKYETYKCFFYLLYFFCSTNAQLNRDETISLNGEWEIIYDKNNEGKIKKFSSNDGFSNGNIEKNYGTKCLGKDLKKIMKV